MKTVFKYAENARNIMSLIILIVLIVVVSFLIYLLFFVLINTIKRPQYFEKKKLAFIQIIISVLLCVLIFAIIVLVPPTFKFRYRSTDLSKCSSLVGQVNSFQYESYIVGRSIYRYKCRFCVNGVSFEIDLPEEQYDTIYSLSENPQVIIFFQMDGEERFVIQVDEILN